MSTLPPGMGCPPTLHFSMASLVHVSLVPCFHLKTFSNTQKAQTERSTRAPMTSEAATCCVQRARRWAPGGNRPELPLAQDLVVRSSSHKEGQGGAGSRGRGSGGDVWRDHRAPCLPLQERSCGLAGGSSRRGQRGLAFTMTHISLRRALAAQFEKGLGDKGRGTGALESQLGGQEPRRGAAGAAVPAAQGKCK